MALITKDDGWRIPDRLWKQLEPLLRATRSSAFRSGAFFANFVPHFISGSTSGRDEDLIGPDEP